MKKLKLTLAAIFAIVLGICCFAACNSSAVGTYKFYSMSYTESGISVEIKAGETYMGYLTLNEDVMTVTLNEDGTAVVTTAMVDITGTGTWKEDESDSNKIIVTIDGDEQTFTRNGSELTLEEEGITFVLKK